MLNKGIHLCIFLLFFQVRREHLVSECGKVIRQQFNSVGESWRVCVCVTEVVCRNDAFDCM